MERSKLNGCVVNNSALHYTTQKDEICRLAGGLRLLVIKIQLFAQSCILTGLLFGGGSIGQFFQFSPLPYQAFPRWGEQYPF